MKPYYDLAIIQHDIQHNISSWELDKVEEILIRMLRDGGVSQFIVWSENPFKNDHDLYWFPSDIGGWNGEGP